MRPTRKRSFGRLSITPAYYRERVRQTPAHSIHQRGASLITRIALKHIQSQYSDCMVIDFSKFTISDYAAWWGAVIATLALIWNIVIAARSGARVKVRVSPNMKIFHPILLPKIIDIYQLRQSIMALPLQQSQIAVATMLRLSGICWVRKTSNFLRSIQTHYSANQSHICYLQVRNGAIWHCNKVFKKISPAGICISVLHITKDHARYISASN